MIHPNEALKIIREVPICLQAEIIALTDCLNRQMVDDQYARFDSPPFSKSAMDGYAIMKDDPSDYFEILETVPAGKTASHSLTYGKCIKIMTGAPIPNGCTQVVRVEYTIEEKGFMRMTQKEPYDNIIFKGENHQTGDLLLPKCLLKPRKIGILAAEGIDTVSVYRRPKVGIIATGSELKEPGEPLIPGFIYNSNSYQLFAQLDSIGINPIYYGIAEDDETLTSEMIQKALKESDVLILTGGVSMGEFDFVPKILSENQINLLFQSIAIKPGKPTVFGSGQNKFVYGLPGNPVSTFVIFEVFVKPLLFRIMGIEWQPQIVKGTMKQSIKRKDTSRVEYRPVVFTEGCVYSTNYQGSAHLDVFSEANALIVLEIDQAEIKEGDTVSVRLI